MDIESDSPEQTRAIGCALGAVLRAGDIVGLIGPLGAGKTTLVKGIAAGADLGDSGQVTSPTFVLVNEYEGRVRLFHVDAYRLGSGRELDALGLDEFIEQGAVVIEWADRVGDALPAGILTITIVCTGEQTRRLTFAGENPRAGELARAAFAS